MKTPVTFYGGKQKLLKHILPLIPDHTIYTESFAGGLAVFFGKEKVKTEIINDLDARIINFYDVLQSNFEELKKKIAATPYSRAIYKVALCMYEMPHLFSSLNRAWAFYTLSNQSFSASIGSWGCYKQGTSAQGWENKKLRLNEDLKDRLKGVQIECSDALKIITSRDSKETFHYVDAPYYNSDCRSYKGKYTKEDFKELLDTLSSIEGKFLLSSYPSEVLDECSEKYGWNTKTINQNISVANIKGASQKRKTEVLTANYPI